MQAPSSSRWILLAAPIAGFVALLLASYVAGVPKPHDAPLFPLIRDIVEGFSWVHIVALVLVGLLLGLASRSRPWLLGLLAIAWLPVAAIAELVVDHTSHNMFPFEFAMYGFYGLLAGIGAMLGGFCRSRYILTPSP